MTPAFGSEVVRRLDLASRGFARLAGVGFGLVWLLSGVVVVCAVVLVIRAESRPTRTAVPEGTPR